MSAVQVSMEQCTVCFEERCAALAKDPELQARMKEREEWVKWLAEQPLVPCLVHDSECYDCGTKVAICEKHALKAINRMPKVKKEWESRQRKGRTKK